MLIRPWRITSQRGIRAASASDRPPNPNLRREAEAHSPQRGDSQQPGGVSPRSAGPRETPERRNGGGEGTQNRFFELFYERYLAAVEAATRAGAFDFGVEEIRARNLRSVAEPQTLFMNPASGVRTTLQELEGEVDVERRTFETVLAIYASEGFYRNLRSGRIYGAGPHLDTRPSDALLIAAEGPRRGLERSELAEKYERVDLSEARRWWEAEHANTPATEARRIHILSGAIFPIYDKIMGSSSIHSVKIVRATLADGCALVGLILTPSDVPNVKQPLGIGTPRGEASLGEILGLRVGGTIIELDNGWHLTQSRIAGDEVSEVILNGVPANRAELSQYGLSEEIINYKRRWFVMLDEAPAILQRLLTKRRPIRDTSATGRIGGSQ